MSNRVLAVIASSPPEHQRELAAPIPGAKLEIVDRAGHDAPRERPGEVMAAIRTFLRQP